MMKTSILSFVILLHLAQAPSIAQTNFSESPSLQSKTLSIWNGTNTDVTVYVIRCAAENKAWKIPIVADETAVIDEFSEDCSAELKMLSDNKKIIKSLIFGMRYQIRLNATKNMFEVSEIEPR